MILNIGNRTDIPGFYSDWFYKRIQEGYVFVRNPYNPFNVTKYLFDPEIIDGMIFCTKNPFPMLERISLLSIYDTFWFVTITPYEKDVEPYVPTKAKVIHSFQLLSEQVGRERISWRYDPIFITSKYSIDYHIEQFGQMANELSKYTRQCVISFLDLYEKTKRNFKGVGSVTNHEQEQLVYAFSTIGKKYGLQIHLCCENKSLVRENVDADGCMSKHVLEKAWEFQLEVPKKKMARKECPCLMTADIGAYNTCGHGCLYCYANDNRERVMRNMKMHDKDSPLLIGKIKEEDVITLGEQKSWKNGQIHMFDIM